ncbi:MAG: methionyl-tRNA formyltransferase [Bacteroidales bacterium]|nr:methionyl-tRNA formyltransferase [Bacteroidales bacterium]
MKKLDRFTLKAFIGPFAAILVVVVFILMMQFLWLYIDELVGKGLGIGVIVEFMMWGTCTILPTALPLATLLSSMMVIGSMGENKELMAVKAAGISLGRLIAPIMVASALISVGAFFVGNDLVPTAYNKIFTLRDDITHTKESIKIPSGTFYEGIDGYVLRVDGQDDRTGMMYNVQVYDHTAHRGNTSVIIADSAILKMSKAKDYLTFTLYNGSNYQEDNNFNFRDTAFSLNRIDFSREEMIIPLENYSFEKSDSSRFGDQAKSMRLAQLVAQKDSLDRLNAAALTSHYDRMRTGARFSRASQLDTARRGGLRSPFRPDGLWKWETIDEIYNAYEAASSKADEMHAEVISYNHDIYQTTFYLRRTDVELLIKFAQAIACFILFFIGAPLGAMIKKGGIGVSAIVSVLFFMLYWILNIIGTKMAKEGTLSAFNGVFISAYILVPIGIFLTYKAVRDAELFNTDTLKSRWRVLLSYLERIFHRPKIVYMGTPDFAVAPLAALLERKYKVVAVVTVADKPEGRGLKMGESAVKRFAVSKGIPVLQPVKLKDPEFLDKLRSFKADLFVVVAFRMLPEEVWRMPRLGTFNLHASLLPQYRGAAPINWAIINGEKLTGVTTFMIDKNIDTGGIIMREDCRISPDDNFGILHDKLMDIGSKLVCDSVEGLLQHNVELRVQRSFVQGSEVLHPAPKLTRELCRIDWARPAEDIRNLIRGLSPAPAAFTMLAGDDGAEPRQLKIFSASVMRELPLPVEGGEKPPPGSIFSDGRTYLAVAASDGFLSLGEVQLGGKKRMEIKAFLAGFRNPSQHRCE